jgi:hypothetical protein
MKWAIGVVGLIAAAGCGMAGNSFGPQTVGSGKSKSETRTVGSFDRVVSKGSPDVQVTIGDKASIEVTADDNIVPLITTETNGTELVIGSNGSYNSKTSVVVKIVTPALKEMQIKGSGNADIEGLSGDKFYAKVAGSGEIKASGITKEVEADCDGSGEIDLTGIQAKTGDVSIHGSGNVSLSVSDELDASIFGSGSVAYVGSPKVTKNVQGSGSVSPKG